MSDRQSQAHSIHLKSFNDRFRKALRLNRDHKDVYICLKMTGYREHIEKWNSVTRTRRSDPSRQYHRLELNCALQNSLLKLVSRYKPHSLNIRVSDCSQEAQLLSTCPLVVLEQ